MHKISHILEHLVDRPIMNAQSPTPPVTMISDRDLQDRHSYANWHEIQKKLMSIHIHKKIHSNIKLNVRNIFLIKTTISLSFSMEFLFA